MTASGHSRTGFMLGPHSVTPDGEPLFVAELGICHGGSEETALALARAAIAAGAHCVKTESFQTNALVFDPAATCSYTLRGQRVTEPLARHMARYELPMEAHARVCALCREHGVPFMCTVHDVMAVDFMVRAGASALKVASPDIVHYPLLRHIAGTGLPVFLDTGAALLPEIVRAIDELRKAGQQGIVVNHNPVGHPASAAGHHLRMLQRMKHDLGVPMGLSDHYEGEDMLALAVMVGAVVLEKPVSFDNTVQEPERNWSANIQDIPRILHKIREAYQSLGNDTRELEQHQQAYRDQNRLACAAAHDLAPGDVLTLDSVTFGRPRRGIGVEHWDRVAGRTLRTARKKHEFLQWEDLS